MSGPQEQADRRVVRVEIVNRGGTDQRVVVDGVDISHAVSSINVQHRGGAYPVVDMRLLHAEVIERLDGQVRAVVERLVRSEAG